MYKRFLIFLIRNTLVRKHTSKTFEQANEFCEKNPQFAPHIVITTRNKSTVN